MFDGNTTLYVIYQVDEKGYLGMVVEGSIVKGCLITVAVHVHMCPVFNESLADVQVPFTGGFVQGRPT